MSYRLRFRFAPCVGRRPDIRLEAACNQRAWNQSPAMMSLDRFSDDGAPSAAPSSVVSPERRAREASVRGIRPVEPYRRMRACCDRKTRGDERRRAVRCRRHARRQILIPRPRSVWIRREMRPRPPPDIRRYCGIEHELDLGSMSPYFARIRHTEAEYGWKRRVDTRKLRRDWNVTGLPRFWQFGQEGSRGSRVQGFSGSQVQGSGFERARAPELLNLEPRTFRTREPENPRTGSVSTSGDSDRPCLSSRGFRL